MKYDLRLRTIGGEDVLEILEDGSPPAVLCKWRDRGLVIQEWLEGRVANPKIEHVILNLPGILKESTTLSFPDKQYLADWIIYALFSHPLHAKGEDVLHATLQVLLFDVLIPSWPEKQNEPSYQDELLYTLHRWFALVKDPQRSWFERKEYPREQALWNTLFKAGTIYPFYVLSGFPELGKDFARWFLAHYDLTTCAKIHASLYLISNERRPWWRKFLQLIPDRWWIGTLVFSILLIFSGLLLPFFSGMIADLLTTYAPATLSGLLLPFFSCSTALSTYLLLGGGVLALSLRLVRALFLPRMLGAIGVGYILLLITSEMWEFAFHIWHETYRVLAMIISLTVLVASFCYLSGEMGNKVSLRRQRRIRSLLVLFIGLAQSLVVGIVSCSLVGPVFMREVIKKDNLDISRFQIYWGDGLPGPLVEAWRNLDVSGFQIYWEKINFVLYPEIVLFFAPLALFIGIVSQILWEEKEITSPL